jgi:hypothetical protein
MTTLAFAPPKPVQRWVRRRPAPNGRFVTNRSFFEKFAKPERSEVMTEVVAVLRPSLCDADGVWTAHHIRLRLAAVLAD